MLRPGELQLGTKIGLRRLRRKCKKEGHDEHVALIDKGMAIPEVVAAVSIEASSAITPPSDDIILAPDGSVIIRLLDWFIENGDEILALIAKLIEMFAI